MNNINLLFTSVGRRVALIKHFYRALNELKIEGSILGADASDRSPAFHITDKSYIVPRIGTSEYIPRLLEICAQEQIKIVIPLIDTELYTLAENRHRFEEIGTQVIIATPEVIKIGMYKRETYEFFRKNNIDTPKLLSAEDIKDGNYKFPLMIKPDDGSAGKMVFKAENENQLRFFIQYVPNAIVQEFIEGNEYTLDVFINLNGELKCIVPRLRLEVRAGEVSKGLIVKDEKIIQAGKRVGECLNGARGCITLQCIVDSNRKIKMVEINPRFGGGAPLSIEAGADFPKWVIQMTRGEEIGDVTDSYEEGLMMLRYDDAIFIKEK
jgi:carbamoyl-phosphate synthase large subunit